MELALPQVKEPLLPLAVMAVMELPRQFLVHL
jgi:hypothetical protein